MNPFLSAVKDYKKKSIASDTLTLPKEKLFPEMKVGMQLCVELLATISSIDSNGNISLRIDSVKEAEPAENDSTDSGEMSSKNSVMRVQTQESHG